MTHKHVLTIQGQYEQIREACEFVCDGARTAGFDEQTIFHVELACDEACTNIIEHAYEENPQGQIRISYETDKGNFIVTFHDNGRSFNINSVPTPSTLLDTPPDNLHESLKIGGLGIHFMRQLMDEVLFQSDPQQGNTLTLIKQLPVSRKR
ncbi:MAG: ATP-binding protein [Ardenticatenaceae bacterium]|nr:ATP-binding protein [Ardenticatenaceae bacterium]